MQTISITAIPKYRNCGLKTEVLYKVRSVMSPDNPLNCFWKDKDSSRFYTPGKGVKLPQWFNKFAYKNAKKISSAFLVLGDVLTLKMVSILFDFIPYSKMKSLLKIILL